MFRPAPIVHAHVYIPANKREQILAKLSECALCEIKAADTREYKYDRNEPALQLKKRIHKLLRFMVEPTHKKESFFKALLSAPKKTKVTFKEDAEIIAYANETLAVFEDDVLALHAQQKETHTQIRKNKETRKNLAHMPNMRMSWLEDTENLTSIYGVIRNKSLEELTPLIEKNCICVSKAIDKKTSMLVVTLLKKDLAEMDRIIHKAGIDSVSVPHAPKFPSDIISDLVKEHKKLNEELREIEKKITALSNLHYDPLVLLAEEVDALKVRADAHLHLRGTEAFTAFEAWIPEKNLEAFAAQIAAITENHYIQTAKNDDGAPTVYDNGKVSRPFEMLTTIYAPPKSTGFDPSPMLAFTFPLFFAFMLTDVVYGALLLIAGLMLLMPGAVKFGMTKEIAGLLTMLGLFTTLLGMVFGSYFGDFFQSLGYHVPALLDPMKDIVVLLAITLVIGVLHMSSGLFVGFYENLRMKNFKAALGDQLVWILFVAGIVAAVVTQGTLIPLWGGLMGAGVVLQLIMKFKDGGPIISVLSLSDFMGFIGDVFSYSRLMAMAIGTAGIALAVNFLSKMVFEMVPYIGIVFAALIFVGGHLFNFAMNGLGSGVHAMRLHFLEHFSKFYEGGGTVYRPFNTTRKLTIVEEN